MYCCESGFNYLFLRCLTYFRIPCEAQCGLCFMYFYYLCTAKSKDTQRLRQIKCFIRSFFFRIFAGNFVKEDVLPFMMRRVKI